MMNGKYQVTLRTWGFDSLLVPLGEVTAKLGAHFSKLMQTAAPG
jgi:hypothetical protein